MAVQCALHMKEQPVAGPLTYTSGGQHRRGFSMNGKPIPIRRWPGPARPGSAALLLKHRNKMATDECSYSDT